MAPLFDLSVYRGEPSPEDILAANTEIRRHELAISSIHSRIASLLTEVAQLRVEEADHQAAIRTCKGVTTLARLIPDELLAQIFQHCVADGWTLAPVVVSAVCSAWRRAARAPRVWSHVYVNCSAPDAHARTRYWLGMARAAPLDVTLVSVWNPTWQLEELMDLLVQHSPRWRALSIDSTSLYQVNVLLARIALARARTPALRQVTIQTEVHFDETVDDGATDVVGLADALTPITAPALTTLRYVANVAPRTPIFPAHLQHLALVVNESPVARPLSANDLLTALAGVPQLRSLTLSMPLHYEHPYVLLPDVDRAVILPLLTTLTMYGPTDLNELLFHLRAPQVKSLHLRSLEDMGYRQQPIAPSLLWFLESSSPASLAAESEFASEPAPDVPLLPPSEPGSASRAVPLELLELHDIDVSPEAFVRIFRALPFLRELRLHESSISGGTLRALHGPRGLCPRLARVDFRWCGHLSGRALVVLVRSRLPDWGRAEVDGVDAGGRTAEADLEEAMGVEVLNPGAAGLSSGASGDEPRETAVPFEEVAVINCCFVEEQDVLDLARLTTCRVVLREDADDYCRTRDCCGNVRYRTRLRLKHMVGMPAEARAQMRLIV
ncbi:hypothetical protein FOMPIDRAFT_1043397 [Fomitopsis schrenkii]|uniref:F-box domain-containing protein n=1 Tax=Fomitopsis schrenkii TaxID=2126942 RepID=S8DXK7_FOMSC|nr:hypothetical protein FOMPIDRAFT_1043397 [Fomitopsis schrenkii]